MAGKAPKDKARKKPSGTTDPAAADDAPQAAGTLTARQRQILDFIASEMSEKGYPPSVREIGAAVGLTSPSTVHSHLARLQKRGFLRRDPTKPRAIAVRYDATSGAAVDRGPVRHVPLVGEVAAGTDVLAQQNITETLPLPAQLTGDGELFMLQVRGESMIEAGIMDGDYLVVRSQPTAEPGEIVVAGIPGDEATVKTWRPGRDGIVLEPANPAFSPIELAPDEVHLYGRVVTVLRKM